MVIGLADELRRIQKESAAMLAGAGEHIPLRRRIGMKWAVRPACGLRLFPSDPCSRRPKPCVPGSAACWNFRASSEADRACPRVWRPALEATHFHSSTPHFPNQGVDPRDEREDQCILLGAVQRGQIRRRSHPYVDSYSSPLCHPITSPSQFAAAVPKTGAEQLHTRTPTGCRPRF